MRPWSCFWYFQAEAEKRREEQRNFGVFFDDDYDYLQHLKEASGPSELVEAGPLYPDRQTVHFRDEDDDEEEQERDSVVPVSRLRYLLSVGNPGIKYWKY